MKLKQNQSASKQLNELLDHLGWSYGIHLASARQYEVVYPRSGLGAIDRAQASALLLLIRWHVKDFGLANARKSLARGIVSGIEQQRGYTRRYYPHQLHMFRWHKSTEAQ